ncbi:MAG TPA: MBL fold metallo-hydrolase [Candidatus Acidoferrales bacterium]|jgi:glyoxylase-like metal-dependent hydrolase (beta-lactamase superfamily II)|nr:MBL fold metallo-hydrolase [Candidatus Acidoferrales bacterium]
MISSLETNGLRFDMFTGEERFLAPNAVLISARNDAILIDCGFVATDVEKLLALVKGSGKRLRSIFITYAHPDHYGGVNAFAAAFPDATLLARQGVIDGMLEWPAKRLHWQDMFGGLLPAGDIVYPQALFGKAAYLEDREILFLDLPVAETVHATAFYVPSARALIAGDLIYHGYHPYMADTNSPASWLAAIEQARGIGPIDTVFPGHGKFGGAEIFAETIRWLKDYQDVAKPGVHFTAIAREMMRRYPSHGLPLLLWLTRGPGFGTAGAKEIGVPAELLGG